MSDQIFRKKSLDRISSPEQLNDYIRMANPGIWMILAAVIILLAGVCVWGHVEETQKCNLCLKVYTHTEKYKLISI